MPKCGHQSPGDFQSKCVEATRAQQGRIKTHCNSCSVFLSHSSSLHHFFSPPYIFLVFITQHSSHYFSDILWGFSVGSDTHGDIHIYIYTYSGRLEPKSNILNLDVVTDCMLPLNMNVKIQTLSLSSQQFTSLLWFHPLGSWLQEIPVLSWHIQAVAEPNTVTRSVCYTSDYLTIFSNTSGSAP